MHHAGKRNTTDTITWFWDLYLQYLADRNVKPKISMWYMIRAKHYIKALSDKRLADHGPEDVVEYLKKQSCSVTIEDWQFRQIVDAIQRMFEMLDVAWLDQVDWQQWLRSSSLT